MTVQGLASGTIIITFSFVVCVHIWILLGTKKKKEIKQKIIKNAVMYGETKYRLQRNSVFRLSLHEPYDSKDQRVNYERLACTTKHQCSKGKYSRTSMARIQMARLPDWLKIVLRSLWSHIWDFCGQNFCLYIFMLLFPFSIFSDRWSLKIKNENNNTKTLTTEVSCMGLWYLEFRYI